jgi:CheY-like chemotaxis protein
MTEKKKILLVEDEPATRTFYAEFLSPHYDVETADDGEQGLVKLQASRFDLVLLDIMMPTLDGVGFLEQKKENLEVAQVPVVILTNLGSETTLKKCFDLGAKSFILKAVTTPNKILPVIEDALKA